MNSRVSVHTDPETHSKLSSA